MAASTKITTKSQKEPMVGLTPYGAFNINPGMDIASAGNAIVEIPKTPPNQTMGKEFKSGDSFKTNQEGQNLFPGLPTIITGSNFQYGGMNNAQDMTADYSTPMAGGTRDVATTLAKWAKLKNIDYDDLVKEFTALSKKDQVQAYTAISAKLKEEETQLAMTPTAPMGMMDNSMEVAKEGGEPCFGCYDKYNPSPQAQDLNWFYKKEGGEAFPQANTYPQDWANYSGTMYAAGGEAFPQAQTYLPYDRPGETRPNFMFAEGGTADQFGGQYTGDKIYKIMEAGGLNMNPKLKRGKNMSKDQFSDYLMKNGGLTKYQTKSQVSDYGIPEGTYTGRTFPVKDEQGNDTFRDNYLSYSPLGYLEKMKQRGSYMGDIPSSYDEQVKLATQLQKTHEDAFSSSKYGATSQYGWTALEGLDNLRNTEGTLKYGDKLPQSYIDAWAAEKQNIYDQNRLRGPASSFTTSASTSAPATNTTAAAAPAAAATTTANTGSSTASTATPSVASGPAPSSTASTTSTGTSSTGTGSTTSTTGSTSTSGTTNTGATATNTGTSTTDTTPQYTEEQIKAINQRIEEMMRGYRKRLPTTPLGVSEMMLAGRDRAKSPFGLTSALIGAGTLLGGLGKGLPMTAALPFKAAGKGMRAASRAAGAPLRWFGKEDAAETAMYGGDLGKMFLGGIFGADDEDGKGTEAGKGNEDATGDKEKSGPYFDIGTQQKELAGMRAVSGFLEDFNANKQALKDRKLSSYNTMNIFQPVERTPQMSGTYTANATMGSNVSPNITGKMIQDPGKSMTNQSLFTNAVPQTPGDLNKPLPYSAPVFSRYGGMLEYEDGGEYDLDIDTIRELIRLGYDVEMI
jgi:hypothetical protein